MRTKFYEIAEKIGMLLNTFTIFSLFTPSNVVAYPGIKESVISPLLFLNRSDTKGLSRMWKIILIVIGIIILLFIVFLYSPVQLMYAVFRKKGGKNEYISRF